MDKPVESVFSGKDQQEPTVEDACIIGLYPGKLSRKCCITYIQVPNVSFAFFSLASAWNKCEFISIKYDDYVTDDDLILRLTD